MGNTLAAVCFIYACICSLVNVPVVAKDDTGFSLIMMNISFSFLMKDIPYSSQCIVFKYAQGNFILDILFLFETEISKGWWT